MGDINNKIYTVYKHTSPSNKVYIGITYLNPERRWRKDGSGYKSSKYFYNAIKKYGWDNFQHEILFANLTKEEAEQKEIELISYYNSADHNSGYNISYGGNSVGKHSDESKRKISISRIGKYAGSNNSFYGKHHSIEVKDILSKLAKERYVNKENHPFYGRPHSEETKRKLSELNKGKCLSEETKRKISESNSGERNSMFGKTHSEEVKKILSKLKKKPVWQYSLNGEFLKEWESALDVEIALGISHADISECCRGEGRTSGGFIWKFKGDDLDLNMLGWYNQGHNRAVVQYSKKGEYIRKFNSVTEASLNVNVNISSIISCCKGSKKTAGKYIWRYDGEELTKMHLDWCNSFNTSTKLFKSVFQYTDKGVFIKSYNSMSEAARENNIKVSSIGACCRGKNKTAGGYIWKYAENIINNNEAI